MFKKALVLVICSLYFVIVQAQEFIPLWPKDKKPGSNGKIITDSIFNERIWRVANPGIYAFRVAKSDNTGTSY